MHKAYSLGFCKLRLTATELKCVQSFKDNLVFGDQHYTDVEITAGDSPFSFHLSLRHRPYMIPVGVIKIGNAYTHAYIL